MVERATRRAHRVAAERAGGAMDRQSKAVGHVSTSLMLSRNGRKYRFAAGG
jgi:hypothetical protein